MGGVQAGQAANENEIRGKLKRVVWCGVLRPRRQQVFLCPCGGVCVGRKECRMLDERVVRCVHTAQAGAVSEGGREAGRPGKVCGREAGGRKDPLGCIIG